MTTRLVLVGAAVLALTDCAGAAKLTLVRDGRSDYAIVLSKNASPSEHRAASELKEHLRLISGADMPVVHESTGPSIVIGQAPSGVNLAELGNEGFVVKTVGRNLYIAGGHLRGTMYGVYDFLEDVLGCRWYSSKVSKIPKSRTVEIGPLDIKETPAFEYRYPYWFDAFDKDWAARNRTNGSARLDSSTGGKLIYGKFVHTFAALVPESKYWDSHPEYYSMVRGVRTRRSQLCLTNPDVLKIATETVLRWMDEMPEATIFSVSPNDGQEPCKCEKCAAVDAEEGSPAGTLLRFVNAIAAETEKKYPNILVDTLAYMDTIRPPKITRPLRNVHIRLCPILGCNSHSFERCPVNADIMECLEGWSILTDNLYIWHYCTDFDHYLSPFPNFEEIMAEAWLYKRFDVKGIFWQGNSSPGGEFAELRAWMIAKLSWDPKLDGHALVREFIGYYYGKSAPYIQDYFDLIHREVKDRNVHMNVFMKPDSALFTPELFARSGKLFDQAEKAADSPEVLQRVRKERLGIDYMQLVRPIYMKQIAGREKELLDRLDSVYARFKEFGITNLGEGRRIDDFYASTRKELGG